MIFFMGNLKIWNSKPRSCYNHFDSFIQTYLFLDFAAFVSNVAHGSFELKYIIVHGQKI